ncbi:hypothetical protein IWW38_006079, partial [Coemansia aciculifera]
MTEIGEKGINLSGGQKARVSLARAVYSRADVYILDDPLAAVDAHVGKHIFAHVLGPQGMLKTRARILVTNAVQYLSNVDSIVMLRDGQVAESGSFSRAMDSRGEIFEFVHKFIEGEFGSREDSGESGTASGAEIYEDEPAVTGEVDGIPLPKGIGIRRKSTKQTIGRSSIGAVDGVMDRRKRLNRASQDTSVENGRTMTTEVSRQGKVEGDIYRIYIQACGARNAAMFASALLVASVSNVSANMWLKHWASTNAEKDSAGSIWTAFLLGQSVVYYLFIYGAIGLLGAVMSSLQSFLLWTRCSIRASKQIHESMLRGVLRSPMSFFDVTPLGRILNRFSSDLRSCDEMLPRSVSGMVNTM